MKKLIQQLVRFGFVGGSAFLIDYGILFLLTERFGIHYLISGFISFSVSVVYNYILSVYWVFDVSGGRNAVKDFSVFIILSIIGLLINQLIMWLSVDKAGLYYMAAKLIATAVVMVFNFVTRKKFLENVQ